MARAARRAPCALFLLGLAAGAAHAQEVWAVLPAAGEGVEPATARAFGEQLRGALDRRAAVRFVEADTTCSGPECARRVGREAGVVVVVFGTVRRRGDRVLAEVSTLEVASGTLREAPRVEVRDVAALGATCPYLARAVVEDLGPRRPPEPAPPRPSPEPPPREAPHAAEAVDTVEAEPAGDEEGRGRLDVALRLGAYNPVGSHAEQAALGFSGDVALWFEGEQVAFEVRAGYRRGEEGQGYLREIPLDVGLFAVAGGDHVAALVGGGVGAHHLEERWPDGMVVGRVLETFTDLTREESTWAFATWARAGVLLARTAPARVAVTLEYGVAFVDLNGEGRPQSLTFATTVMF